MSQSVLVDVADQIAWITLNRADQLNAMSPELSECLAAAFGEVEADGQRRFSRGPHRF
jgi:enoyl-CoA hydratase/carnithine racemase